MLRHISFSQVKAVALSEWRAIIREDLHWKLVGAHLGLAAIAVLLAWPSSQTVGRPGWPWTWHWYVYLELAAVGYLSIALTADSFALSDRLLPKDWITHGGMNSATVIVGRVIAAYTLIALLLISALPIAVLAYSTFPVTIRQATALLVIVLGPTLPLLLCGLYIGTTAKERSGRVIATDAFFALAAVFLLILAGTEGDSPRLFTWVNPIATVRLLLEPKADPSQIPWVLWFFLHALGIAILTWVLRRRFNRWQSATSASQGLSKTIKNQTSEPLQPPRGPSP